MAVKILCSYWIKVFSERHQELLKTGEDHSHQFSNLSKMFLTKISRLESRKHSDRHLWKLARAWTNQYWRVFCKFKPFTPVDRELLNSVGIKWRHSLEKHEYLPNPPEPRPVKPYLWNSIIISCLIPFRPIRILLPGSTSITYFSFCVWGVGQS